MLVTFVLVEGPDYRIACTYDDVTLAVQGLTVEQARKADAPVRLWMRLPLVGETTREVKQSSLLKELLTPGIVLEWVRDVVRGDRLRLPEGTMLGGGAS